MLLLDIPIVNVALPAIQRNTGAGFDQLQWVIDAYSLALAGLLLAAGSLADQLGRRLIFVAGVAIFSFASLLCGLSGDATVLDFARGLQGVGGAAMFATSLALLAQEFHRRERGTAFGLWGATIGGAVAIGPLVGGVLTDTLGWEWIFFVNVPIGVAAVALTLLRVPEARDPDARGVDRPRVSTVTASLLLLVLALLLMGGLSVHSRWTALLAGFIVAGVGVGMVNPVLATTAVGVVPPARSGMASGINNTFRQVGIATGVAALGAIFQGRVQTKMVELLGRTQIGRGRAEQPGHAVSSGQTREALTTVPGPLRGTVAQAARQAFVGGLNELFVVAAAVAFVGAL